MKKNPNELGYGARHVTVEPPARTSNETPE